MRNTTSLNCACGNVTLELSGVPILCAECHCNSCRRAAEVIEKISKSSRVRASNGGTPYVLYRKDRIHCTAGEENLKDFALGESAPTRRVIASCCNTPLFLEFKRGHWVSLYASLWPASQVPAMDERTMTSDLADRSVLSDDLPNAKTQSLFFMTKLLKAWIAMGFRTSQAPAAKCGKVIIPQ